MALPKRLRGFRRLDASFVLALHIWDVQFFNSVINCPVFKTHRYISGGAPLIISAQVVEAEPCVSLPSVERGHQGLDTVRLC